MEEEFLNKTKKEVSAKVLPPDWFKQKYPDPFKLMWWTDFLNNIKLYWNNCGRTS